MITKLVFLCLLWCHRQLHKCIPHLHSQSGSLLCCFTWTTFSFVRGVCSHLLCWWAHPAVWITLCCSLGHNWECLSLHTVADNTHELLLHGGSKRYLVEKKLEVKYQLKNSSSKARVEVQFRLLDWDPCSVGLLLLNLVTLGIRFKWRATQIAA